jgi:hypothetical protein
MKTCGYPNPNNLEAAVYLLRRSRPLSGLGGTHESRVNPTTQDRVIDLPHGDGASGGFTSHRPRPCARKPAFDDYDPLCIVDRVEADQYLARSCSRDRTLAENGAPTDAPGTMEAAGGRRKNEPRPGVCSARKVTVPRGQAARRHLGGTRPSVVPKFRKRNMPPFSDRIGNAVRAIRRVRRKIREIPLQSTRPRLYIEYGLLRRTIRRIR